MKKGSIAILIVLFFIACPTTWENSCKIYLQQGAYQKAKEQALLGIQQSPDNYLAYTLLGKAELGLNNYIEASKAFKKAFEVDSARTIKWFKGDKDNTQVYWQAFYNSALSFTFEKKYDEALKDLKFSILIDSSTVSQYILLGNILSDMGDKEGAVNAYKKALKQEPENAESYYSIGNVYFDRGIYDSCLFYYGNSIKYFMRDYEKTKKVLFKNVDYEPFLAQEIARLWREKKKEELQQLIKVRLGIEEGLESQERNIEKFTKTRDGLGESYYFLGMVYQSLKNDTLAYKNFKEAVNYIPDNQHLLISFGELLIRMGRWSEARSHFETAANIRSDDFAILFYLGVCYAQEKNYKKAIEIYEKALVLSPENPDLINNLAYAYREIGNTKKALEYFEKLKKLQQK